MWTMRHGGTAVPAAPDGATERRCTIDRTAHVRVDMHRYLPGLLFLQVATAALVWATLASGAIPVWALLLVLALIVVATAFWCGAITRHRIDLAIAKASSRHGDDLERLKARSDRERVRYEATARRERRQIERRSAWKARTKTVLAFGAAGSFGVLMLLTELFTLGLLTLGSAGSGIAGYLLHWRQTRRFDAAESAEALAKEPALPALPYDASGSDRTSPKATVATPGTAERRGA